jgi:hypothetical protein
MWLDLLGFVGSHSEAALKGNAVTIIVDPPLLLGPASGVGRWGLERLDPPNISDVGVHTPPPPPQYFLANNHIFEGLSLSHFGPTLFCQVVSRVNS